MNTECISRPMLQNETKKYNVKYFKKHFPKGCEKESSKNKKKIIPNNLD